MIKPLDEFAKAALTGLLANHNRSHLPPWRVVIDAYEMAEKMEEQSKKVHERRAKQYIDGSKQ